MFVVFAIALLAYGVALAVTGFLVNRHLRDARTAVQSLRTELVDKHIPAARIDSTLAVVQREAAAARSLTDGPVWAPPTLLPWLRGPFETVRGAAAAVDDLATRVLPDLRTVQRSLLGGNLQAGHGTIRLAPFQAAQQPLARAATAADTILRDVRALPDSSVGPLETARTELVSQVSDLSSQLHDVNDVVDVLPSMLGAQGPRRYFMAFQNNAESRGLGGMVGAYAIVRADNGKLSFDRFGTDGDFDGLRISTAGLDPDFLAQQQGAGVGQTFVNATASPHFPYAGELLLRYWQAKTGERLDGAIVTDPAALGRLLKVTGPTQLPDGTPVTAENVVSLSLKDVYARFAGQAEARKLYLVEIAKAVAKDVLGRGPARATELAKAMGSAIGERRLLVYSTHQPEQRVLAAHPVAGLLSDTKGIFAGVIVNNAAANKLDYYLQRQVTYSPPACGDARRISTVTIKLTNGAPKKGLNAYVAGNGGQLPWATSKLLVSYYATKGATFTHPTLDGKPTFLSSGVERGRPVFTTSVTIPPQASRTLVLKIEEPPTADEPVTTLVQPLVLPQVTRIERKPCRTPSATPAP
ncbi:hypothetical protein GCM10009740_08580 [Terrabacter terrae]|uniref:DUF4012 domain-containing protein n=1 Tax=Terrabacter terrae TaxID=318434 RepID=A0ABN3IP88_9MICO